MRKGKFGKALRVSITSRGVRIPFPMANSHFSSYWRQSGPTGNKALPCSHMPGAGLGLNLSFTICHDLKQSVQSFCVSVSLQHMITVRTERVNTCQELQTLVWRVVNALQMFCHHYDDSFLESQGRGKIEALRIEGFKMLPSSLTNLGHLRVKNHVL